MFDRGIGQCHLVLTSYAYGNGGSVYCGADISPNSKGCCSEARTVKDEGRERRRVDKVKEPRIVSAPHAIDM